MFCYGACLNSFGFCELLEYSCKEKVKDAPFGIYEWKVEKKKKKTRCSLINIKKKIKGKINYKSLSLRIYML